MKLTLRRYSILLFIQLSFLFADLIFNSFAHLLLREKLQLSILMFVTQDIFIICEYLFFTFAVHSTCVYEVGAHIILRNCKFFLFTILTYFLLSASQHFWIVYNIMWAPPMATWPSTLTALAFVQRLVSFVYYYTYKRTALAISDPRYYEDNIDWIAEQLSDK